MKLNIILTLFFYSIHAFGEDASTVQNRSFYLNALKNQGVSENAILGFDRNEVPQICLHEEPRSDTKGINGSYKGWDVIPSVIRDNGEDSFRVIVNMRRPVKSVVLQNIGVLLVPNKQDVVLNDEGINGDAVAGDFLYTSGEFVFDTSRALPQYWEYDPDSPQGLYIGEIGTIHIIENDNTTNAFLINPSIGYLNSDIELIEPSTSNSDFLISNHLINIKGTERSVQHALRSLGLRTINNLTNRLYEVVQDNFDFLFFLSVDRLELEIRLLSDNFVAGKHFVTQVNYTGTGRVLRDFTESYGSSGRLLSINLLDTLQRGHNSRTFIHELTHQWSSYTDSSLEVSDRAHYNNYSSAGSVFGGVRLIDLGLGNYQIDCSNRSEFTQAGDLDKYMAGFIPAAGIAPIFLFNSEEPFPGSRCDEIINISEISRVVPISEIIDTHGIREPGPETSRKEFNIGIAVESHERLLNPVEFTFYHHLAKHITSPFEGDLPVHNSETWASIVGAYGEEVTWTSQVSIDRIFKDSFE